MTKKDITPKTLEQLLREKAESSYTICSSNECPLRQSCLQQFQAHPHAIGHLEDVLRHAPTNRGSAEA